MYIAALSTYGIELARNALDHAQVKGAFK
jgi:hypothetical protein